jgi:hypothetical protein
MGQRNADGTDWDGNFPNNTILESNSEWTTGDTSFVFKNHYEPGRCNISIVNFTSSDSVWVDVSGVYSDGAAVDLYNAQNYFDDPPFRGIVRGSRVRIPMLASRWTQAIPSGESQPLNPTSFPLWGAFVAKMPPPNGNRLMK